MHALRLAAPSSCAGTACPELFFKARRELQRITGFCSCSAACPELLLVSFCLRARLLCLLREPLCPRLCRRRCSVQLPAPSSMAMGGAMLRRGVALFFFAVLCMAAMAPAAQAASAPAPAPVSDGMAVDQGIAYVLVFAALVLTYLIHPLDAFPYTLFQA